MVRDFLNYIRYSLPLLTFNRKRNSAERLKESFGKLKDESFDFETIGKYFRNKNHQGVYQVLSDKTCKDLDFDELFAFLDRTNSKVGQQYLYNTLRCITVGNANTKLNEELILQLSYDAESRILLQKQIEKLNHKDAYNISTLFHEEHLKKPKWFFIVGLLSFTSFASLILGFINPAFFAILLLVFCVNFIVHIWNKNNLVQYVSSIPQLLKLNSIAAYLYSDQKLKVINPSLSKSIKLIDEVKSRMSFFQLEARLQGDTEMIAWFFFEIFKTVFLLEPLLLFGVLKRLNTKRKEIEEVFEFVGHVDMLISIASLRAGLNTYCIPVINEETKISAVKINHPLISNCTTNDIEISEKSILLTGSNMSGKTSFIRAVGLNVISGLTINTCFAESMSFPVIRVFSAIRISDDLMNDRSYYFEEVLTIKEMIDEGGNGNKNLFLLDELFKGTNTVERISAGKAVLSALSKEDNIVLVSTHDIELTDMLHEEYELYHFSETVNENTVGFDYKLKSGKLKNRNAIRILEINGYPKNVIKEAIEIAKELDEYYI